MAVKPYEEFLARLRMAERIAVGGGVAGAEIAMALRYRGARVTPTPRIPVLSPRVANQLRKHKVDYRPGMAVTAIEPGLVGLRSARGFRARAARDRGDGDPGCAPPGSPPTSAASRSSARRCKAFRIRKSSRSATARRCARRRIRNRRVRGAPR